MDMEIRLDCSGVDWKIVAETLKRVGMAYYEPDVHKTAFEASHTVVFVYHNGHLIGFGRAISDGAYQGAVYDVAIVPEFQKKGVGTIMMKKILDRLPGCNIILYSSPGKEGFYRSLEFRKMKTGMALFINSEKMKEKELTE